MMNERALLIHSDPQPPSSLTELLSHRGLEVDAVTDYEQAWKKVAENQYPLIFCSFPAATNVDLDFIKDLRRRVRMHSHIFVLGPEDVSVAVKVMQSGARYYWPSHTDTKTMEDFLVDGLFVHDPSRVGYQNEITLLQVIKEIALTMELDGLVNIVMDSAMELTGADGGALFLVDEKSNNLVMKAIRGLSGHEGQMEYFGLPEKRLSEILAQKQPVFLHHMDTPLFASNQELVSALIIAPIWWKNEALGILLNVKYEKGKQSFSNDDFKLLSLLTDDISGAVYNAITHYKMKELTIKDDLTEAYNRRYFEQFLEEELMRARRYGANLSLIFFDVDNLKEVNLKHGHLIGSKTLQEVARRMILTVRGIDKVVRYGGDEFCIVLPETDTQGAYQVADRIRSTVASKPISITDAIQIYLTGSMGIASFPMHAGTKEDLIRQADRAMFVIKNQSKNAIAIAEALPK
jgi:diguanylate cyclase (GGDEF)-like protein